MIKLRVHFERQREKHCKIKYTYRQKDIEVNIVLYTYRQKDRQRNIVNGTDRQKDRERERETL
jgi:hypothetical protein